MSDTTNLKLLADIVGSPQGSRPDVKVALYEAADQLDANQGLIDAVEADVITNANNFTNNIIGNRVLKAVSQSSGSGTITGTLAATNLSQSITVEDGDLIKVSYVILLTISNAGSYVRCYTRRDSSDISFLFSHKADAASHFSPVTIISIDQPSAGIYDYATWCQLVGAGTASYGNSNFVIEHYGPVIS